jgi:DNA-binding XRE family transcriptional regulator
MDANNSAEVKPFVLDERKLFAQDLKQPQSPLSASQVIGRVQCFRFSGKIQFYICGHMYEPRPRLISARQGLGLNRTELAQMVGISPGFVIRVEHGERDPSPEVKERWLAALGPAAKAEWFLPPAPSRGKDQRDLPSAAELLSIKV